MAQRLLINAVSVIAIVCACIGGVSLFLCELGTSTSWGRERVVVTMISLFVIAVPIIGTVLVRRGFPKTGTTINIVSFLLSICAFFLVFLFIAAAAAV